MENSGNLTNSTNLTTDCRPLALSGETNTLFTDDVTIGELINGVVSGLLVLVTVLYIW